MLKLYEEFLVLTVESWLFDEKHEKLPAETFAANKAENVFFSPIRQGTIFELIYRSGTVNSKSFVGKVLLRIKWKFKLTYAL